jgi:hypothetical protein
MGGAMRAGLRGAAGKLVEGPFYTAPLADVAQAVANLHDVLEARIIRGEAVEELAHRKRG